MSSTVLKLLAMLFMLLDHIHQFLPNIPIWFTWIGRLAAPIFFFVSAWGFKYTHDRKKHLLTLYIAGVIMAIGDLLLTLLFPDSPTWGVSNNIMVTILVMGMIIYIIEAFIEDKRKGTKYLLYFLAMNAVSFLVTWAIPQLIPSIRFDSASFIGAIIPNVIFNEGSIFFAAFGVALYYTKESNLKMLIVFLVTSLFCLGFDFSVESLLYLNYQWMMIFAWFICILYNHQKGPGLKYLFYVFYPAHIWILFIISNLCFQ